MGTPRNSEFYAQLPTQEIPSFSKMESSFTLSADETVKKVQEMIPLQEIVTDAKQIEEIMQEATAATDKTIIVVHDHKANRNIVIILIKEFGKNITARIFSIFSYYVSWQSFINLNPANLSLSADYSNMIQMVNVMRELLRFITQDTKMAFDAKQSEKLQSIFLTLHIAALYATLAALVVNQSYAFSLSALGRSEEVSNQLTWVPSEFSYNYYVVMVLTAYFNYTNGRGELGALMAMSIIGGLAMMGSYFGLSQLSSDLTFFILANSIQNITIPITYLLYLRWQHGNENLISHLAHFKKWPAAFKEGFKTVKLGLQPAFVSLIDISRGILTNLFIHNPLELKAYQIVQFMPNVFSGMAAIEPRIAAQCLEVWNTHQKNPVVLKKELYQILMHSMWIASLPPAGLLAFIYIFRDIAMSIHISQTQDNTDLYNLVLDSLLIAAFIPLAKTWLYVLNGVITAFKKMKDPVALLDDEHTEKLDSYYQKINRHAVTISSTASITSFLVGKGMGYVSESENQNYWGAYLGVMLTILPLQLRNAIKSIQHTVSRAEANVNNNVRERFSEPTPSASQSWFSMFTNAGARIKSACENVIRRQFGNT